MLMAASPLHHVAQKGSFKIFKCKKHGETLENFFLVHSHSIVDYLTIVPIKRTIP
jgi:hypothetical protein